MSADLWLEYPSRTDPDAGAEAFHINVTYNLSPILRACGWEWNREILEGVPAADIGEAVIATLAKLEAEPDRWRAMNPPNGWGNYDGLLTVWREFAEAVEAYPDSRVHTSF